MRNIKFIALPAIVTAMLLPSCRHLEDFSDNYEVVQKFYIPAEFEPLESVWLSSPTVNYKQDLSMLGVQADMIKEIIATSTKVDYGINSAADSEALREALLLKGVSGSAIDTSISFHTIPHGDLWIRDTGGLFLKNKKKERQVVDFDFDAYRMKNYVTDESYAIYQLDNDISYSTAAAKKAKVKPSTLITEGGNLHFNGKGTVIAVRKALVASNPQWTIGQIEEELKRVFNLKKVIFLNENTGSDSHPVLESPLQVNGEYHFNLGVWHADEIVSWVNPTTVIVPQVPEAELADGNPYTLRSYYALEDAYKVLTSSTDQDGKKLTVLRAPEPSPIVVELKPGDVMYDFLKSLKGIQHFPADESPVKFVLAASYMNYVVTDDLVLIPKFYKPGRDRSLQAKDEVFRQLILSHYPGREVRQIEVDGLTVGGGGMHCITQQVPELD